MHRVVVINPVIDRTPILAAIDRLINILALSAAVEAARGSRLQLQVAGTGSGADRECVQACLTQHDTKQHSRKP